MGSFSSKQQTPEPPPIKPGWEGYTPRPEIPPWQNNPTPDFPYWYLHQTAEGTRGLNFRASADAKTEFKLQPGVSARQVAQYVAGMIILTAIPFFGFPYLFPETEEAKRAREFKLKEKQIMRESKMLYTKDDTMPDK